MFASPTPSIEQLRQVAAEALGELAGAEVGSLTAVELAAHLPALHRLRAVVDAAIVDAVGVFDVRKQFARGDRR